MLSSIVVEHLRTVYKEDNIPVLCMYLNHKEQSTQTQRNLMGSLLRQLVQHGYCSDDLRKRYENKPKGTKLNKRELQEVLCLAINHHER